MMAKDEIQRVIAERMEEIMFGYLQLPKTPSNEGTPKRLAKMWCNELFVNRNEKNRKEALDDKMSLFDNEYNSELVIVKDIKFNSICEHHWLPFCGTCTVGYVPDEKVIGLSKIPRIVEYYSKMPQLQEQLTTQIGKYLIEIVKPVAVFVEMESEHLCVKCRGAESECTTHTNYWWYDPKRCDIESFMMFRQDFKDRM